MAGSDRSDYDYTLLNDDERNYLEERMLLEGAHLMDNRWLDSIDERKLRERINQRLDQIESEELEARIAKAEQEEEEEERQAEKDRIQNNIKVFRQLERQVHEAHLLEDTDLRDRVYGNHRKMFQMLYELSPDVISEIEQIISQPDATQQDPVD